MTPTTTTGLDDNDNNVNENTRLAMTAKSVNTRWSTEWVYEKVVLMGSVSHVDVARIRFLMHRNVLVYHRLVIPIEPSPKLWRRQVHRGTFLFMLRNTRVSLGRVRKRDRSHHTVSVQCRCTITRSQLWLHNTTNNDIRKISVRNHFWNHREVAIANHRQLIRSMPILRMTSDLYNDTGVNWYR